MNMENTKLDRVLEIFFRGLRGEDLSVQRLADEYEVSTKSITRSINDLKTFWRTTENLWAIRSYSILTKISAIGSIWMNFFPVKSYLLWWRL